MQLDKKTKLPTKKHMQIALDIASGMTSPDIIKKYKLTPYNFFKIKNNAMTKLVVKERQRAIKQTVFRVFGKFDSDYELMVGKYMQRLLEDERIDKTSLLALASIVETFANIYKKVSEIDVLSKKQLLDVRRYQLEKKHLEVLKKMKLGDVSESSEGTSKSIISEFYEKLNELATEDFQQKDADISNELTEIDLRDKTEGDLNQIRGMINKQLNILEPKETFTELNEKRHIGGDADRAHTLAQKRAALEQGVEELNLQDIGKDNVLSRREYKKQLLQHEQNQKDILEKHINENDEEIK